MAAVPTQDLLTSLQRQLAREFGPRLRGVVLYGSEARGEARPDSDVDVLVLLDGPVQLWVDSQRIMQAIYNLQLIVIRPIHATPVDFAADQAQGCALYRHARRDGRAA